MRSRSSVWSPASLTKRAAAKPVGTGEYETIEVDSVIGAVGQQVDLGGIAPEGMTFNKNGTVVIDPVTGQTTQNDIFAGGDGHRGRSPPSTPSLPDAPAQSLCTASSIPARA